MPLSPSDVQYLNKLLDRHLKNQRSWPLMRYFSLAFGVFMIAIGLCLFWESSSIPDFDIGSTTTRFSDPSASQAVTHETFLTLLNLSEQASRGYTKMVAMMTTIQWTMSIGAGVLAYFGFQTILLTLIRWNHHRRDAILITLLREKCATELAPPAPITPEVH